MATKSKTPTLELQPREQAGTTSARALRHAGRVPAIVYGHGAPPVAVAVDRRAIEDIVTAHRQSALLEARVAGAADTVVMKAIQRDPVSRAVVHVDFQRVSRTETVTASLPIVTVGISPGVRDQGGMIDVVTHALEVSGPADKMPEEVQIDVSGLNVHEHISAKDVQLPAGFTVLNPPDTIVVTVDTIHRDETVEPSTDVAAVPTVSETEAPAT